MPRWKYLYTGRPSAAYRCTCGFSWRPGGVGGRPKIFATFVVLREGLVGGGVALRFFFGFSAFGGRFSFLSAAKMSSTLSSAADAVSDDDCAAAAAAASAFRFLAFFLSFAIAAPLRAAAMARRRRCWSFDGSRFPTTRRAEVRVTAPR